MKKKSESQVILFENFFNQNVGNDFFQLQHRFCHVCDFQIGFLNLYFNIRLLVMHVLSKQ